MMQIPVSYDNLDGKKGLNFKVLTTFDTLNILFLL